RRRGPLRGDGGHGIAAHADALAGTRHRARHARPRLLQLTRRGEAFATPAALFPQPPRLVPLAATPDAPLLRPAPCLLCRGRCPWSSESHRTTRTTRLASLPTRSSTSPTARSGG